MKRGFILTALAVCVVCLCGGMVVAGCSGEGHFLTDKAYRHQVERDFGERRESALGQFIRIPEECSREELEALEFLYAYMPMADVADYPTEFYLDNVRESFEVRDKWNVPERIFRHFVLPIRVNNENLDSSRVVFRRELEPRIQGLSMQDAILEVNHWCHEKVTYQPSDARTTSPLATALNALGRCGEESTFTVAALRSVGIPARQVYTPRWAHTDDNHAWVEAWADGQWYFMGACEPEPVLNLGWFNAPASRAMLMHTKVFGLYDGPEEVVLRSPNYTEVNLIDNYARTARVDFRIVDAGGAPVPGARVDFCIYNYAEFYPAVTKYADSKGRTFLSAGLGDLLVWASKDGRFGFDCARFGEDSEVTIALDLDDKAFSPSRTKTFSPEKRSKKFCPTPADENALSVDIVPPPETANIPEVTPEQRAANDARFAREDSLRHAYEATFPTDEEALEFALSHAYERFHAGFITRSRGNWRVIEEFMASVNNRVQVEAVLSGISGKDLRDITLENLMDSYNAEDAIVSPRVENEFLWPYKGYFAGVLGDSLKTVLRNPETLVRWVADKISILEDPLAWRIPMSPQSVWKARQADGRSRDIFFVALARTMGIEARKDPVTGKLQYLPEGRTCGVVGENDWVDVNWEAAVAESPKGVLKLSWEPVSGIDNPKYYSHFTLSKIVDGRPRLLTFDEGEVDMGGGVDWKHVFRTGYPLDEGLYLLVSGNRLSSGAVHVTMRFVEVKADAETTVPLVIRQSADAVAVIGAFDSELRYESEKGISSFLATAGRGYFVTALLDPGKEPTNHVLRDLSAASEALDAWGRPIFLLCESKAALAKLQAEMAAGRYGTLPSGIVLGTDPDGSVRTTLDRACNPDSSSKAGDLPLVVLSDSFNRVFFSSSGYTIGLGDRLAAVIAHI